MNGKHHLIGKRVKEARIRRGVTQAKLAEEIDCTPGFLSRIETGKKEMSLRTLVQIANALEASTDELLRDEMKRNHTAQDHAFEVFWADCTEFEKRVIMDTLFMQKKSMRENAILWEAPKK